MSWPSTMVSSLYTATARRMPFAIPESELLAPPLPPRHFLATRPLTPPPTPRVRSERPYAERARPDTTTLAAADYDVSVHTGFLPPDEPVQRLELDGWVVIEECFEAGQVEALALEGAAVGRLSDEWRERVRELPRPSTDVLSTLPLLRRAHVLLSFLGHMYIHSDYPSVTSIPSAISIPWVEVSDQLGIPPILTYADTVLWNWSLIDRSRPLRADNVQITTTFTSSPSEHAFFLLSLLCELHAPILLQLMSSTLDESFFADPLALTRIASYLDRIASVVEELTKVMSNATRGSFGEGKSATIGPECFYWEIRPWFNGGKWVYEGASPTGTDKTMEWGGPSAGQSSLVHALDLFLGVDHSPRPSPTPNPRPTDLSSPTPSSTGSMDPRRPFPPPLMRDPTVQKEQEPPSSDSTFMIRAAQYMPAHHRDFLSHLSSLHLPSPSNPYPIPSIRSLALMHPELRDAYDNSISSMKRFRDSHMKLVTVFIISQSKKAPIADSVFFEDFEMKRVEGEEALKRAEIGEIEKLVGTGGTELVGFLKGCRERTVEAKIGGGVSARRGSL